MPNEPIRWTPLFGPWSIEDDKAVFAGDTSTFGFALSNKELTDGTISASITIDPPGPATPATDLALEQTGQFAVGYDSQSNTYLAVGLGGFDSVASLSSWSPNTRWTPLIRQGEGRNLLRAHQYRMTVTMQGQALTLMLDGAEMFTYQLARPLIGTQIGLVTQGAWRVTFEDFQINSTKPKAFAAMPLSGELDSLYRDVLVPVTDKLGINLVRADEILGPGFIIQDIVRSMFDASVIVADISHANPNVYFEIGYAYALRKPLILLAQRGNSLPFDVAGMRVIFYDDTIGGKAKIEREFERHLRTVLTTWPR